MAVEDGVGDRSEGPATFVASVAYDAVPCLAERIKRRGVQVVRGQEQTGDPEGMPDHP